MMDDSTNIVSTIQIDYSDCIFHIASTALVVCGPRVVYSYPIPIYLQGQTLQHKDIIRNLWVLQIGNLVAQMTLQGREEMVSCVKYYSTQKEQNTNNRDGRLITFDQLTATNLETVSLGEKHNIFWTICPTKTVVPILYCDIRTVNDQLFKMMFRQLLSIEYGSQEQWDKQARISQIVEMVNGIQTRNKSQNFMQNFS